MPSSVFVQLGKLLAGACQIFVRCHGKGGAQCLYVGGIDLNERRINACLRTQLFDHQCKLSVIEREQLIHSVSVKCHRSTPFGVVFFIML
jgi:hypothetical protein